MKKLLFLFVSALFVFSCGEDLESNTPAFQGDKDGSLWRADYYSAEINSNGKLVITGGKGSETVVLTIASTNVGTYTLGEGSSSKAEFNNTQNIDYSTNNEPDPIIQLYPADGEITIEKFNTSGKTITGSFWFNAFTESGLNKVNYSKGVFYKIPVSGGSGTTIISCDDAVAATATAAANYVATDVSDPAYTSICNSYATALANQIVSCGDDTGVLQGLIDGLDCSGNTIATCQTCTSATLPDGEYCDNGDGTMEVTINGDTNTVNLNGVSFDMYIQTLEASGYTCE